MSKNCPNCGAVYTLEDVKCPYCGTLYFDMTGIDFTKNEPIFIKYILPFNTENNSISFNNNNTKCQITQCVKPRLGSMEISSESYDVIGGHEKIISYQTNRTLTSTLEFVAVPFGEDKKKLMEITIPQEEK